MISCGDGFEEYTGRHVSTTAPGVIGPLVLYHLPRFALARDSRGLSVDRVLLPADLHTRI